MTRSSYTCSICSGGFPTAAMHGSGGARVSVTKEKQRGEGSREVTRAGGRRVGLNHQGAVRHRERGGAAVTERVQQRRDGSVARGEEERRQFYRYPLALVFLFQNWFYK